MPRIEKTVFISYRRTNIPWALAIFQNLTQYGYDVFFDFSGINSGDFETVIVENIRARAHFLVILTPSALEKCGEPGDWLRREIEAAFESRRNIVPLMLEGFDFGTPTIADQLTGTLEPLKHYNALNVPADYFLEAMGRLRDRFLNIPLDAVLHPASRVARQAAEEQKEVAAIAPGVVEEELTSQLWFERGNNAVDLDEKERYYTNAIRLKPDYVAALYNRGNTRRKKGDLDGAITDCSEAIRLKPDHARAFNNRGLARAGKSDLEGAMEDYNEAIRLNRYYAYAFSGRGAVRLLQGDLDGALEDYNEAIRLKPDYANGFSNRGWTRQEKGDLEGALLDYNEAIRLKPDHPNAIANRDVLLQALSRDPKKNRPS